jgi:hypothetical protein
MIVDNAPTNLIAHWTVEGGDTGRRKAEHRSFEKVDVHSL